MKIINLSILMFAILAWSCQPKKTNESSTIETPKKVTPTLTKVWESDTTILTPESVIFNEADGILYVSCIAGVPPTAKDGDGYIAKISPEEGSIVELKWVTGMHAPKGMGIVNGKLYVTDIDEIIEIDIAAGTIANRYAIEGATFLNDIDVSSSGDVFITDMGTNKIHLLKDGQVSTVLEDVNLGGPNGLLHLGDKLMASSSKAGNFYEINTMDWTYIVVTDSIFGGDGVEKTGDDFLVSSWNGEIYYVAADGSKTKMLDTKGVSNTADIEFVEATSTVYVPTFFGNQVVAYKLTK
jgi:hypothetical protein